MNVNYETHKMKDPRIPFIFHLIKREKGRNAVLYNWHENIELICVEEGSGFVVIDEEHLAVKKGDVVVINPNRLHGFCTTDSGLCYDCLIVDRAFFIANFFDSNNFVFNSKICDDELVRLISSFKKYHYSTSLEEPMRIQHMRSVILQIALIICEKYAAFDRNPPEESHSLFCIKQAIGYIRAEGYRDVSLDEIAAFAGLSKYYFSREFRRITGQSFVSYLNSMRCEKARELLLEYEVSIGEVGERCGFCNQSYFTRTFKRYAGITPCEYRKSVRCAEAQKFV